MLLLLSLAQAMVSVNLYDLDRRALKWAKPSLFSKKRGRPVQDALFS
jgi:hypothetical protein